MAILLTAFVASGLSQELEPRAFWVAPVRTNALTFGYTYSTGDTIFDPTVPLTDVTANYHFVSVSYYRALDFLGRSANFTVAMPYSVRGNVEGLVGGAPGQALNSGLADPFFRFAVNLRGGPTMDGKGFLEFRQRPRTLIGVSVRVQPPLGQYDPNGIVNLGTNRWALKPMIGVVYPVRREWLLEFLLGGWFFTRNNNLLGKTQSQQPVGDAEVHLIHRIRPGFWASLDATFFYGGRTTIDGVELSDIQRNSRLGGTVAFPLKGGHVLKLSFNSGVWISFGGNHSTASVAYQYSWNSRR